MHAAYLLMSLMHTNNRETKKQKRNS